MVSAAKPPRGSSEAGLTRVRDLTIRGLESSLGALSAVST